VVRGDLQKDASILSTYATTLALRSFKIGAAITAHFDLEMKQFDVVNTFINAVRSSELPPVICKLPLGFEKLSYVAKVDQALYGLRDSLVLWYDEWTRTLKQIGLAPLNKEPCIFVDPTYRVFILFYIDNLQVLYYKDDEVLTTKFIKEIERAYKLRDIKDVK
jgi:Reverse transcriptase (RNA-dependent DNA polymerase)